MPMKNVETCGKRSRLRSDFSSEEDIGQSTDPDPDPGSQAHRISELELIIVDWRQCVRGVRSLTKIMRQTIH